MIYFITITFDKDVHAGCLGFTRQIMEFVEADTLDEARELGKAYITEKYAESLAEYDTKVIGTGGSVAVDQDGSKYLHIIRKATEFKDAEFIGQCCGCGERKSIYGEGYCYECWAKRRT